MLSKFASISQPELAAVVKSLFKQRGLYDRLPLTFSWPLIVGDTGPRLTVMDSKGPDWTHPPPSPEGRKMAPPPPTLPLWATKDPSPLMLVAEPSNTGEPLRLDW